MRRPNSQHGLTIVEMMVYIAVLSVLTVAVVNAVVGLISTFQRVQVVKRIEQSAVVAMERITREIRNASSVDLLNSTLATNPGILQLNAPTLSGGSRTVRFLLQNGSVRVIENGVDKGPLTSGRASTTNLVFRLITTPKSQAVKVEMTTSASSTKYYRSVNFYDTVILRGSY